MKNYLEKIGVEKLIIILLYIVLFLILLIVTIIYIKNDSKVAILGYHGVLPKELNTSGSKLVVNQEDFEEQLKYLKKHGYKSMSLEEFYCWKKGECKKSHKSILITFDDGYMNNFEYAFDLLKKYDMKAVVFYVGKNIDSNQGYYMNIETLKKTEKLYPNIEIASHTYALHEQIGKSYEVVDKDIKLMKNVIDSTFFAYPHGDLTDEYISALKDNGYRLAFTFGPGKEHRKADLTDDNYKIPRLNISKDMPMYKFILRLMLPM